ncbi:MAG TPA: hypothetical protein VFV75_03085 [Candidatus Polarisedimenticolaceae bacterium]|nr:hypothetical protein [Candidatus Polarisedimenticolaceae bacterium]
MRRDLDQRMIADLARLRREPPFSVDVTARVAAEVRRMGPPPRVSVASRRVAVGSALGGLAAAIALAALLIPGLQGWSGELGELAGWAAGALAAALVGLPAAAARAIAWSAGFLASFRGLAAALAPAVAGALAAALAGMVAITAYVVGRDVRRGRRTLEAR